MIYDGQTTAEYIKEALIRLDYQFSTYLPIKEGESKGLVKVSNDGDNFLKARLLRYKDEYQKISLSK